MALEVGAASALWSAFTAKAELLGAAVMRTSSDVSAAALLRETAGEFVCTASAARLFPGVGEHIAGTPSEATPQEVVAAGDFAVAETGSVAVNEPRGDRGLCFLAERLWLLVPKDEIVPTVDAAMLRMRELVQAGAPHPLLMSGPSRTADIERVLTVGVHGPRALVVVVIGQA
jgi:L-lactate dehydrogenase complex protein LldG